MHFLHAFRVKIFFYKSFFFISFNFFLLKLGELFTINLSCSTGDTSLRDFYIITAQFYSHFCPKNEKNHDLVLYYFLQNQNKDIIFGFGTNIEGMTLLIHFDLLHFLFQFYQSSKLSNFQ